jgi:hypothetical protein
MLEIGDERIKKKQNLESPTVKDLFIERIRQTHIVTMGTVLK